MSRPAVDVVVPFAGSDDALGDLLERMGALERRDGDTLTIVDNRAAAAAAVDADAAADARRADPPDADVPHVTAASGQQSSYYARNRGAERGRAPWILFLDADVDPPPDLINRYFDEPVPDDVGVLAGAVRDAPLPDNPTRAELYAVQAEQMSQENTLRAGAWAYAQTANAAVRRDAFTQVGGFTEGIRSGGDADLCFRLRVAGWELAYRTAAEVVHHNRAATRAFLRQKVRHGAGAAWLNKRYPGSFPPRDRREWLRRLLREIKMAAPELARGNRDRTSEILFPTIVVWAFELGRFLPNKAR